MKIPEPYKCDIEGCGAMKGPSNHWYLGLVVDADDAHARRTNTIVMPWVASLADRPGTQHLCGVGCVQKFVSKNLPVLKPATNKGAPDGNSTEAA